MEKKITYSPAYTIVPTYECFNKCSYCNFRVDTATNNWLTLVEVENLLKKLSSQEVIEILVLSGEVHPQSARRRDLLKRIQDICQLALSFGFLPHTNAGILTWEEMQSLKKVNVSLGLMLEQITPKLLATVHKYAPSKQPEIRLQQLEFAGKLKIPFTTGLLLGIGETKTDRLETLKAIADIHQKWGHIQEVILQPHSLGTQQSEQYESFHLKELPYLIQEAKKILPSSVAIQIPPNLIRQPKLLLACLEAGATDLGGISPKDEVNPDYPHLTAESLATILQTKGWNLIPRLPIYPQYYDWFSSELQNYIKTKENELRKGELTRKLLK